MAKKPQSKNQSTINRLLKNVKEPQPTHDSYLSCVELSKLLNWYRNYGDHEKLSYYFEVYCKDNGYNLSHLQSSEYVTYGIIIRLVENGFKLTDNDFNKVIKFCEMNHCEPIKDKPSIQIQKNNDYIIYGWKEDIEYGLDCHIIGNDYDHHYETSKSNIKKCIDYLTNQIDLLKLDYKDKCYTKTEYNKINAYYMGLLDYYNSISKAKKRVSVSANKTTVVKKVKFNNDIHPFIENKIYPLDIVGKKKLYTYDVKKNKLNVYIAVMGGFTFTGTTLKNIDDEKSMSKSLKDMGELSQQISSLNKLFRILKRKVSPPSPRFNDDTVILSVA